MEIISDTGENNHVKEELGDFSIWENAESVVQVDKRGSEFRAVMFTKKDDNLDFTSVAFYKDSEKILKLIKNQNLTKVNKRFLLKGRS